MTPQEKIDLIREAQEQMLEALETLRQVAHGDPWAKAFIIAHLETTLTSDHGWLDSSPSLDTWIETLQQRDPAED